MTSAGRVVLMGQPRRRIPGDGGGALLRPTFRDGLVLPNGVVENRITGRTSGYPNGFNPYFDVYGDGGLNTGGTTYNVATWNQFKSAVASVAASATNDIIRITADFEAAAADLPFAFPQRINANLRCDIVFAAIYDGTFQKGPYERVTGTESFTTITRGLTSDNNGQPLFTLGQPGTNLSSGWRFIGLKMQPHPSQLRITGIYMFCMGDILGSAQNTTGKVPQNIIFDRCWLPGSTTCELKGGLGMFCNRWAVINSRIENHWARAVNWNDTMAIGSWNCEGTSVIENNYLDASGENFFYGGGAQLIGANNRDAVVRRNRLTKNYALYNGIDGGMAVTVKNLAETKQLLRLVMEDNYIDGSWHESPNSQDGAGLVWKLQDYGSPGHDAECGHFLIRGNRIRRAAILNNFLGDAATPEDSPNFLQELHYLDNVTEDWNAAPYNRTARGVLFAGGPYGQVAFDHNTIVTTASLAGGNLILFDSSLTGGNRISAFHWNNNIAMLAEYGIGMGGVGEGQVAFNGACTTWTSSGNAYVRASGASGYPAGNTVYGALSDLYEPADITGQNWKPKAGWADRLAADGWSRGVSDYDYFVSRLVGVM